MKADIEALSYRLLRLNPCVALHELRLRMRGTRAFWVLFAYAAIATGVFLITMWIAAYETHSNSGPGSRSSSLGRIILYSLAYTQLVLVLLILPAYSAGAITMEREKRTLDMLRATLLSPSDVVSGKLLVVLGLGLMLLLTSLPIAAWSLLLGGVSPEEVGYVYSYLLVVGAFAAALGMLFSALLGRSVGAVVATYGALLALILVPIILISILSFQLFRQSSPGSLRLGDVWGAILLAALSLVCAWLVFLSLRWVWRRVLGRRLFTLGHIVPVVAVVVLLLYLLAPGSPALTAAAALPVGWLVVLQPFISVVSILEGGDTLVALIGPIGRGARGANVQLMVWGICTVAVLLGAVLCWALSIRVFRVRR